MTGNVQWFAARVKTSGERLQTADGTQSAMTQAAGGPLQVDVASTGEAGESRRSRDGGTREAAVPHAHSSVSGPCHGATRLPGRRPGRAFTWSTPPRRRVA